MPDLPDARRHEGAASLIRSRPEASNSRLRQRRPRAVETTQRPTPNADRRPPKNPGSDAAIGQTWD